MPRVTRKQPKRKPARKQRKKRQGIRFTRDEARYLEAATNPFGAGGHGARKLDRFHGETEVGTMTFEGTLDLAADETKFAIQLCGAETANHFLDLYIHTGNASGDTTPDTTTVVACDEATIMAAITRNVRIVGAGLRVWSIDGSEDTQGILVGGNMANNIESVASTTWSAYDQRPNMYGPDEQEMKYGMTVRYEPLSSDADTFINSYGTAYSRTFPEPLPVIVGTGCTNSMKLHYKAVVHIEWRSTPYSLQRSLASPVTMRESVINFIASEAPIVVRGHSFKSFLANAVKWGQIAYSVIKYGTTVVETLGPVVGPLIAPLL